MTLEAVDEAGLVRDSYALSGIVTPVEQVLVTGATKGLVQARSSFTATASPITTTLPITYIWQATGQGSATEIGGLTSSVTFTWSATGTEIITVTASNAGGGVVSDSHTIVLIPVSNRAYLPLILKD